MNSFIDVLFFLLEVLICMFGSLMLSTIPTIVIYFIAYSFGESKKFCAWICNNTDKIIFISAIAILCGSLVYDEYTEKYYHLKAESYEEGYDDGYNTGKDEGYEKGYEVGYEKAYELGYFQACDDYNIDY